MAGGGVADGDPARASATLEHRRLGGSHDQGTAATIVAHQRRNVTCRAQTLLPSFAIGALGGDPRRHTPAMRQAAGVPPSAGAALDGERGVLVGGFGLQPTDDGELPIEAAADAESARNLSTPAAGVDDPIARDLIAFDAEPPIARMGERNETHRLAQHRAGI